MPQSEEEERDALRQVFVSEELETLEHIPSTNNTPMTGGEQKQDVTRCRQNKAKDHQTGIKYSRSKYQYKYQRFQYQYKYLRFQYQYKYLRFKYQYKYQRFQYQYKYLRFKYQYKC